MTRRWLVAAAASSAITFGGLAQAPPDRETELSVLLQGGWDSNARFVAEPGPTSLATAAKLVLIHSRRFPTAVLSFSGQGGATYFTPEKGVNRFNASGRIGLNWRPSRASELAVSQTVASALTLELPDLLASGLVLPRSAAVSGTSNLEYTRQLGRDWSVGAVGSFQWLHIPTAALVGGSDVAVRTSLGRRVGRHSTLTAVGSQRESRYAQRSSGSRAASLGWSWRGDRGLRLQIEGGVAFPEQSEDRPLVGSAHVGWQGGALRAQAGYRRDVSQAFGIGRDRIILDPGIGFRHPGQRRQLHDFPHFEHVDPVHLGGAQLEQEQFHLVCAGQPGPGIHFLEQCRHGVLRSSQG